MFESNYTLLTIIAFGIYLLFALGLLFTSKKLGSGKAVKPIILAPIVLSFVAGIGVLIYALSSI